MAATSNINHPARGSRILTLPPNPMHTANEQRDWKGQAGQNCRSISPGPAARQRVSNQPYRGAGARKSGTRISVLDFAAARSLTAVLGRPILNATPKEFPIDGSPGCIIFYRETRHAGYDGRIENGMVVTNPRYYRCPAARRSVVEPIDDTDSPSLSWRPVSLDELARLQGSPRRGRSTGELIGGWPADGI